MDLAHNSSYRYTGSAYVEISQSITVDNAMSTTSTNPVQNRVTTEAINNINSMLNNINSMLGALSGTVNISSMGASDGSVVTCTKGGRSIIGTILNESCTLDLVAGTWSITVNDTVQSLTNTTSVAVQVDGSYNVDLHLEGTVNISASGVTDNSVITCTNGVDTITSSVLNESCVVLLTSGTWTITVNDTTHSYTNSKSVTVQAGNTYNVNLNFTIYHQIQKWIREGTIQDHYSIGDQITVPYINGNIIFDVVAFDVAVPADTTKTHSMTLVAHYLLDDYMMFDNKEPGNSSSSRRSGGNNRYRYSNIRLWLNSDGAAGSWWTAQHSADATPDYASTKAGFMNGFDSNFLDVIGETKIKVSITNGDGGSYETLIDKFYLPSTTEVGLVNGTEGALFPYFSSNARRTKNKGGSNAHYWWLRTPVAAYSERACGVNSGGSLSDDSAYDAYGVAPACNIV